jgi:hypothetical protein
MTEQKWIINGIEAPADADIYAEGCFRKPSRFGAHLDYWCPSESCWKEGAFELYECKEDQYYQERPIFKKDVTTEDTTLQVTQESPEPEYTGGSVNYYKCFVASPTTLDLPYHAECNDIIESLGMTFAEGNAFKAIWRRCAARTYGSKKKGYDNGLYDAEKVVFFGERMVEQSKQLAKEGE